MQRTASLNFPNLFPTLPTSAMWLTERSQMWLSRMLPYWLTVLAASWTLAFFYIWTTEKAYEKYDATVGKVRGGC